MVPRRSLIVATAMTVFLTFLLVLVGLQARASAQSAEGVQTATSTSSGGVDPLAAQQAIEAANRQLEEAGLSISELQQQVVTLQQELKSAYATMEERDRHYKALLEEQGGPAAATLQQQLEASQSEVRNYQAREQDLTAQISALNAQLDEAYQVLSEREAAYQGQLQQAYAQIQAQNSNTLANGGSGDRDEDDRWDHDDHEEHDDD